jgi:hypothetical protein
VTMKIGRRTPGERFAMPVLDTWTVFHQYEGQHSVVASGLTERDARLLVFGAKAVAALRFYADEMSHYQRSGICVFEPPLMDDAEQAAVIVDTGKQARDVLADLEVPT